MAGRAVKAWTKLVEMGLPVVTSLFPAIMSGQSVEGGLREGGTKGYEGCRLAGFGTVTFLWQAAPLLLPSDMGWSALDGNTHGANVHNIKHTFYAGAKNTLPFDQVKLGMDKLSILTQVVNNYMDYDQILNTFSIWSLG